MKPEQIAKLQAVYFAAGTVLLHMRRSAGGDAFAYDGPTQAIDDLDDARWDFWLSLTDEQRLHLAAGSP